MKRWVITSVALTLLLPAAARGAGEPIVLEPTSGWVLDYAAERCTLVRLFGTGRDEMRLRIDSFGSWTGFRFTVVGDRVPGSYGPQGALKVRFTPDTEDRDTGSLRGKSGDDNAAAFTAAIVPIDLATSDDPIPSVERFLADPMVVDFERQTDSLLLKFSWRTQIMLKVGRMSAPLKALRACVDDLYGSWGLDPAIQKTLSQAVRPTEQTVRNVQRHYPTSMLANGINAYVPVRMKVEADGRASGCVVQSYVVSDDFKRAVCEGLSGRFEPALDSSGHPIDSSYQTSVFYLIG